MEADRFFGIDCIQRKWLVSGARASGRAQHISLCLNRAILRGDWPDITPRQQGLRAVLPRLGAGTNESDPIR